MTLPSPAPVPSLHHDTASLHTEEQLHKWGVGILVLLLILACSLGPKIAHHSKYFGEGSVAVLLGVSAGLLLQALRGLVPRDWVEDLLIFNPGDFFTYLLPPIIFFAGLSVKKKHFFRNLPTISAFGVLGTYACFTIIALVLYGVSRASNYLSLADCLALGAIFAATDSVAVLQVLDQDKKPLLFSLVFGEGIINDAVSIVLLAAVQALGPLSQLSPWTVLAILGRFVFLLAASTLLGCMAGLTTSWLLRRLHCESTPQEVAIIGLLAYMAYMAGETFHLSGILSLFVCGIVVSHYGLHNVSPLGRVTTVNAFYTLSVVSETLIFVYVGMDAVDPLHWKVTQVAHVWWICLTLLLLLLLSRAAFVVPICLAHNRCSSAHLAPSDIAIIWWSGLMRGAVSVALVYHYFDPTGKSSNPKEATLVSATSLVVLVTLCGAGAATKPMMDWLSGGAGYEALFVQEPGALAVSPSVREIADSSDADDDPEHCLLPTVSRCPSSAPPPSRGALSRQPSNVSNASSRTPDKHMAYVKHVLDEVYGVAAPTEAPPKPRWPRVTVAAPGEGGTPCARAGGVAHGTGALQEVEMAVGAGRPPARPPLHPVTAPSTPDGQRLPHTPPPAFIRPRLATNETAAIIRFRRETSVETAADTSLQHRLLQRASRWWKRFDEDHMQPLFGGPAMPSVYGDTIELNNVGRQLRVRQRTPVAQRTPSEEAHAS